MLNLETKMTFFEDDGFIELIFFKKSANRDTRKVFLHSLR